MKRCLVFGLALLAMGSAKSVLAIQGDAEKHFCNTTIQWDCRKGCTQIFMACCSSKRTSVGISIKNCKSSNNKDQHCCTKDTYCANELIYATIDCSGNPMISNMWFANTCWKNTIGTPCP